MTNGITWAWDKRAQMFVIRDCDRDPSFASDHFASIPLNGKIHPGTS